jgi:hypothetical protein
LPFHFGASGVGAAVSLLELLGHRNTALNRLGMGAAAAETLIGLSLEMSSERVMDPIKHGHSGLVTRAGGILSGPVPLALRLLAPRSPSARRLAALATLAGSLLTRIGWLEAGRCSAAAPAGPSSRP